MQEVGFEPTPPKRLVPETSALDHSATLAYYFLYFSDYPFLFLFSYCSLFPFFFLAKTTMAGFEPTPPEEK